MNGTLNKFRKRNIQTNLYHFILVIFVVAVSVCLISGLFISHITFDKFVTNFYTNSKLPTVWIETDKIMNDDEQFLSENYSYSKRYKFKSSFKHSSSQYEATFLVSDGKVSVPYIVDGAKGKGCYISSRFVEKYHIGVSFTKIKLDYEINGITKSLSIDVVGSMSMAEDMLKSDECLIFIDEKVFLEILKSNFSEFPDLSLDDLNYNQLLITSEVDDGDIEKIKNYYSASESELISLKTHDDMESITDVNNELRISNIMRLSFPWLFVLISILVVVSAINQLAKKEQYNIGLLKSLGVSDKEILSNYSGYGVLFCFIGTILGLVMSPLIIPNIIFDNYNKIFDLPRDLVKLSVPIGLIIGLVVVFCLIGYFSAFFVCLKTIKYSPKECMSGISKNNLTTRKIRKKSAGVTGSTFRNMSLNLSRTIMSIVGISGASLLVLLGFGINSNSDKMGMISVFSNIFKGFSIVLLLLTIIILLTQIFKERAKELAMLRIHGESYVKIWLSIVLEMIFIGIISFIIAGLICEPTLCLILKIFSIGENFYINFLGFLKTFLIVFSGIIFISSFAIIKVLKLDLPGAIKFSE